MLELIRSMCYRGILLFSKLNPYLYIPTHEPQVCCMWFSACARQAVFFSRRVEASLYDEGSLQVHACPCAALLGSYVVILWMKEILQHPT